jgi:hypothetical protein
MIIIGETISPVRHEVASFSPDGLAAAFVMKVGHASEGSKGMPYSTAPA